ncbi:MAG TPA: CoA transferase [Dehalococcoidia bacterium]|nr:CoA transferase [Dehalococcoidia bacterium]
MFYALSGVRVLEVGEHISAPFCTKFLAGLGAEVIKVERPGQGDSARREGPFPNDEPHPEKSGLFLYLNTGKKSITLNLEAREGKKIFLDLLRKADIIVENLGAGVFDGLGLSYPHLERINPQLVMTSISPWGQTGPYRDYQAEDITIQAMSGAMYQQGNPEREPVKSGGSISHYRVGASAFAATLMALHHAENTGEGQFVEVSSMEVSVHDDFFSVELYMARKVITTRQKAVLMLPCKDGWVYFRVFPHEWPRFEKLLGFDIEQDERFVTMEQRRLHAQELEALVLPHVRERSKEETYHWAQAAKVTAGYVANVQDVVESQQYRSRRYFVSIDHPIAGNLAYPGTPVEMGDIPWRHSRAPLLGEHNAQIFGGLLRYTREDLVRLRQTRVI